MISNLEIDELDMGGVCVNRIGTDGPTVVYIAAFAIVTVIAEIFVRYSRYASVLRWLTLSLFAYVGTVFVVGVPWLTVAKNVVVPHITLAGGYLTVVVAVFGTTISPYLFFWQAGEEVEDERKIRRPSRSLARPSRRRSGWRACESIRWSRWGSRT